MKKTFSVATLFVPSLFALTVHCAHSAPEALNLSKVIQQESSDSDTSSSIPEAPTHHSFRLIIGPEASVFFPSSGKTANTYGKTWTSYGLGIGSAYQANYKGELSPFLSILFNSRNGNRAFVVPFGVGYEKAVSNTKNSLYYGGDALAVAADQRSVVNNVHSGVNFGAGLRAVTGYEFGGSAYVQASYMLTSEIKSFDFSGTVLEVGYRF